MLFGRKRIKALEERVEELEKQFEYLSFAFKDKSMAQDDGTALSTKELLDEWLNGGKNDAK